MKKLALLAAIAAIPFSALAHDYDYVELSWTDSEIGGDEDGDGLGLSVMASIAEAFFISAGISSLDFSGTDLDELSAGIGAHTDLSDNLDLFGILSYEDLDIESEADIDGYGVEVGLRGHVTPELGLTGSVKHIEYDEDLELAVLILSAVYALNEAWALSLGYMTGEYDGGLDADRDDVTLGVRYNF